MSKHICEDCRFNVAEQCIKFNFSGLGSKHLQICLVKKPRNGGVKVEKRICPRCNTRYYSSDSQGIWICENCGETIPVIKMEQLKSQVLKLADEESQRSMIKHPLFNSTHEGYAVLKEEVEEAEIEMLNIKFELDNTWGYIKRDKTDNTLTHIKNLKNYAINLASESIQVAAMAQKFIDSMDGEK
jgi:ribosomal protein L37AE/L43A